MPKWGKSRRGNADCRTVQSHRPATMSRAARLTLGASAVFASVTIWGVHYLQTREREVCGASASFVASSRVFLTRL